MDIWGVVLIIAVLLHFIVGFGYLVYKLSPKKKNEEDSTSSKS